MQFIQNRVHPTQSVLYALSRFFNRDAFSFITIISLFLLDKNNFFDINKFTLIFFYFSISIIFTRFIGGFLGNFVLENKKVIILGSFFKILGIFLLFFQTKISIIFGLGLVFLGIGLNNPNIEASVGKIYLKDSKLMDVGFTLQNFAIYLGGIFGPFIITLLTSELNFFKKFLFLGLFFIFSILPVFFIKNLKIELIINYSKTKLQKNKLL